MKHLFLALAAVFSLTASTAQSSTIEAHTPTSYEEVKIIGISIRTTNENGQAAQDIETLWGRFWGEEIRQQVPNTISDEIFAVYTDYETDYTGAYTTIIGLPVDSFEEIPEGFTHITIQKGAYEKFVSKGKMPQAVVNTWMEIWGDTQLNEKRAYQADFTVHGKKYFDGDQAEVETYISVK